jgi:hypothetical protein
MIRKRPWWCAIVLFACVLFACCFAVAATEWVDLQKRLTPEQMRATGLDTLSAEQLALLNRLLRDAAAASAEADARAEKKSFLGVDPGPIATRLVGTLSGWEPGTEFELANGQRWKVLKGHYRLRKPLESPEVRIVPGAAGRWFFRIDDDTPGARVYRVD